MKNDDPEPEVSIVIPLFNESNAIPVLFTELQLVLDELGRRYEIIVVDDGSTDGSFPLLRQLHEADGRLRVIRLRRNFGQTPAVSAGIDAARGEWIVTMDADLQNDPADIPRLLAKAQEGFDIVSGWRVKRHDAIFTRKVPSRAANWLIGVIMNVRLHDFGCALKVYRADVVKNTRLYGDLHRFLPAAASGSGVEIAEMTVNHRPRMHGNSKYAGPLNTVIRSAKVLLDLLSLRFLVSYSTRPIHLFGSAGLIMSAIGVILAVHLTWLKFGAGAQLSGRPLLLLSILLIIVGGQFLSLGLVSDLIVRAFHETQHKPIYAVREVLGKAINVPADATR